MTISNYIRDDLAARVRSGRELPTQLTLDSLAELYNVSFTPVRTAVAQLIEEGVLEKGPNRRLVVPESIRANDEETVIKPAELPQPPRDAFESITNDLVQLSLEGKPVYVREESTAEKYQVSRSAMRNILHRLAGEGILDHIPRRGWRLRPFSQDDLQSFVEVREALELKALDLSFSRLVPAELQKMLDANQLPGNDVEAPAIDESLHGYLIATSGNTYIKDFFARQGRYYRLLFKWEDHNRAAALETVRQHREILTALLERDLDAARKSLSYHILMNHPVLTHIAHEGTAPSA